MTRSFIWITIVVQLIALCTANNDEPLGRNYRKNLNGNSPVTSHSNNGKILSTSETKISSVSYKPNESAGKFNSFSDNSNLKTAASNTEEEKFSIGLGVLSPSYSQKFGEDGKTKLDFNSDKGGFSYSLTNVVHPHQPGATSSASLAQGTAALSSSSSSSPSIATNTLNKVQSAGFIPSAYYNQPSTQPTPQVNIYHKQSAEPASPIYGRLNSNNYPVAPPNPTASSPYSPNPLNDPFPGPTAPSGPLPNSGNYGAANYGGSGQLGYNPYNPYNGAIGPQPFNPSLSDAEKSFLQTVPQGNGQIAAHQHTLPQPLSSSSQPAAQSITQPKLVAQQQLTANPNPPNIVHNANYGPYNNPYGPSPNLYGSANPYGNPGMQAGGYPGLINMAASQQYPIGSPADQMGMQAGGLGGMNYDYLNDAFLY